MDRTSFRLVASLLSFAAGACLLLLLLPTTGCGRKVELTADPTPFGAAVHAYLADQSMDMKVADFKSLTITGDMAQADIALEQAEGVAGVKVRWTFWFQRQNGAWTVSRVRQ